MYLWPPAGLSIEAKALWPKLARPLFEASLTTALDAVALRLLVEAYATWLRAIVELQREGMVYTAPSGAVVSYSNGRGRANVTACNRVRDDAIEPHPR